MVMINIQLLIHAGADVNKLGAEKSHAKCVKVLIKGGAEVNKQDEYGRLHSSDDGSTIWS